MTRFAILMNPKDNVATALKDLSSGESVLIEVDGSSPVDVTILEPIMFGHKFAIREIKRGNYVIKYGETIGVATKDIKKGEHVHVHNIKSLRVEREA